MPWTPRPTSYDEVPYPDDPYPASHPGHLEAVGRLAGLKPPEVEACRVLELGCARGGNLIPMALGLPGSRFLGIDSSAEQVAEAREVVEELGLRNIDVEREDIREVGADLGEFDYILCHGTFSWVDGDVRGKILDILARNLAPNGLAFLSYNTYPGWRLKGLARDLMSFGSRHGASAGDRAERARRVLDFVATSALPFDRNYAAVLGEEVEYLRRRPDSYLLHDHLEAVNEPVYFQELAAAAGARGLSYVSEVQSSAIDPDSVPGGVAEEFRRLAEDEIDYEQYLDFLINRKFRQSVFCRAAAFAARDEGVRDLSRLRVSASRDARISALLPGDEGRTRGVLRDLAAVAPGSIAWGALTGGVLPGGHAGGTDPDGWDLATDLIRCYNRKLIEFRTDADAFVLEICEAPTASPLARRQARLGNPVTNLRHEAGRLNDLGRFVLGRLDGRHDRSSILRALSRARREGQIAIPGLVVDAGSSEPDREGDLEVTLGPTLDRWLGKLARFALLIG